MCVKMTVCMFDEEEKQTGSTMSVIPNGWSSSTCPKQTQKTAEQNQTY